ncbi:MAG TPA: hypothetical protein VG273_07030 [Bryobacteraceae bacterium]|jgi:hypothetical protein|nr:hypothetical protein [Bryobacteraceae bacterium]
MIPTFLLFLLLAPPPASMDQVKAEANPERRARAAVEFAAVAEKSAETAYASGDLATTVQWLKTTAEAMEIARDSLDASGKKPGRSPGTYKFAEQRSREILVRLEDLQRKMDDSERALVNGPITNVQEIHDAWFDGIMGKKK